MTEPLPAATRIHVAAPGDRCSLRGGLVLARRLPGSPGRVRVALVASSALLLAGDAVSIEVVVEGPVRLDLTDISGTVAYAMRGGCASWDVTVRLSGGAVLTWHGEPFVIADGADVTRSLLLDLQGDSVALLRETLVLGRTGEAGGELVSRLRATHGGETVLAEDLDLGVSARGGWVRLGAARCIDSVVLLGARLPGGPAVLQLEAPGSISRSLVPQAHLSQQSDAWVTALGVVDLDTRPRVTIDP